MKKRIDVYDFMSELEKKLAGNAINKKQVIAVALIAGFLVSLFTFSIFLTSSLLGTQRPNPSENLEDSEEEDAELIMPPYPFDLESLMELFENLTREQQEELAESLADMMDGNIDDLDLLKYGALVGALLFSNVEKFRVYDYDQWNSENLSKILWKYEAFDIFNGTSWKTSATKSDFDFYSYDKYSAKHSDADIMQLKMPLSPKVGINSFVLPSQFPTPFIMEDSLSVNNINPGSVRLYKDDFNSSTLDLEFYSDSEVDMYYELFGLSLPSNEEVNNSAVGPEYTPTSIQEQYLQLPPNINGYIQANPYFESHYNNLDEIIDNDDNAFQIANKIRNYMQVNFELGMDARNNDPPKEGEDIVEWFCEHEEGVYSDFASAYSAFTRAFGVASRFINGFNSRNIEEEFDDTEGKNSFVIRYRNIYNWAEIYVPMETNGEGSWVQMDILFETFGAGGQELEPPQSPSSYSLNIERESEIYKRGEQANITATLISDTDEVEDKTITFIDAETEETIGTAITDYWGRASLFLDINNSYVVGPQYIAATYQSEYNATYFIVDGNVDIVLNQPNPAEMNRSITNSTRISGYVYDPDAGNGISDALINLNLFEKSTGFLMSPGFNPINTYTDSNGYFNDSFQVDTSVETGEYEVRADFNGTWMNLPQNYNFINASSNYQDFNITEKINYLLYFYINNFSADYNEDPVVSRGENLTLEALLITEYGDPINGKDISFYDDSIGLITTTTTNSSGFASYNYTMDENNVAGPNYIYAEYANLRNSSYYILDEAIGINSNIWPSNREISRSGSTDRTFTVSGRLQDLLNDNYIENGELSIHMYTIGGTEVFYLIQDSGSLLTDENGYFSASFRVDSGTPIQNYTLQLHFNGSFDYSSEPNPYIFSLDTFSQFSDSDPATYELEVYDADLISISLAVNNNPTRDFYDDLNPPETIKNGDLITFQVQVNQSLQGVTNGTVRLYDVYFENIIIDSYTYNDSETPQGFHEFSINKNDWDPGLHRILVRWESYDTYNDTYIIVNESINVGIDDNINSSTIIRNTNSFNVQGYIKNGTNGLRSLNVSINVYNDFMVESSSHFDMSSDWVRTDANGYYQFTLLPRLDCPRGKYIFRVDFNGSIDNSPDVVLNDKIYMPHNRSEVIEININASTTIQPDTYWTKYEYIDPDKWLKNDILYANGTLNWDNGTEIVGVNITLSVYNKDDLDNPIAVNSSVKTDGYGNFKISLKIDETWPTYRDDTVIKVSYNPYQSDKVLEYTKGSEGTYS